MQVNSERSKVLDAFKGIGIIMIVSIHILQWSQLFSEPGVLNNIRTSGLLGVEITFVINAFLFTKSYEKYVRGGYCTPWQLVAKCFRRIIPLYWLLLLVGEFIKDGITEPWWNIVLHFLCLNWLTPTLFATGVGGSGYIAVLSLMWLLYLCILKGMKNFGSALTIGVVYTSIGFLMYRILFILNGVVYQMPISTWEPWLWYIYRGIYSYSLGGMLYFATKEGVMDKVPNGAKILCSAICSFVIIERILEVGSLQNGLIFAILSTILIALNINKGSKGLRVLPLIGKHSMEIFVSHILSKYILVDFLGLFYRGRLCLLSIVLLTIALVIPLLKIGELLSALMNKLKK